MKKTNFLSKIQFFALTVMANLAFVYASAQDKAADLNVDVDMDKGDSGWMGNPLFWVIGGLVLVLLVALVARGGGNKA